MRAIITMLVALCLVAGQDVRASEIDACNSERVKETVMKGTFEKLKALAVKTWSTGAPGPNTPRIMATLERWTAAIVNIRQHSYDRENNVRFCEADFEYQNLPPAELMMPLMFGEDPACAKAFRYKVQPLLDQPERVYVSWACSR